ncbi:unnamed protein product [Rotaria sp. Silwood2]|nr:unnamed protein product [Rotaria sp. Silwood2]
MYRKTIALTRLTMSLIWRSLPSSSYPFPDQRPFILYIGKKANMFSQSKDRIPIGPISQLMSAVSPIPGLKFIMSIYNIIPFDLIESIPDFETSTYVQLVFALTIPNIYVYSVTFASGFIHSIKLIEHYHEEMCRCISFSNFDDSSLVRNNVHDLKIRSRLNRTLKKVALEYGGLSYRIARAEHIHKECMKKDMSGILCRLWPSLIYASTATGSTFAMYRKEVEFYCGRQLPIINLGFYASSEGFFGCLASINTDEYFLLPNIAFYEFIKEEDIHQAQPKTLLISDIEPGNRYELVCTTEDGLVRYRMGDVVTCTRFLCRSDDLVPLPIDQEEIPRIPLFSIAYRIGSLLNAFGEKTSEQHLMDALQRTSQQWKEQGIPLDVYDFTSYPKLDVFPPHYVLFLELIEEQNSKQGYKISEEKLQLLQTMVDSEIERQLCQTNFFYDNIRKGSKLGPLVCILVRNGTFSTFLTNVLVTDWVSPTQIKPHRLLKNENHIQYFYANQINISSY